MHCTPSKEKTQDKNAECDMRDTNRSTGAHIPELAGAGEGFPRAERIHGILQPPSAGRKIPAVYLVPRMGYERVASDLTRGQRVRVRGRSG